VSSNGDASHPGLRTLGCATKGPKNSRHGRLIPSGIGRNNRNELTIYLEAANDEEGQGKIPL
jgi:hypothetical protein